MEIIDLPDTRNPLSDDDVDDLLEAEQEVEQLYREQCAEDYMCFVRGLTIASVRGPVMFEKEMAYFQRQCFEELSHPLKMLRQGLQPYPKKFWIERTKKAGKDSDLATVVLWLAAFPVRPFYIQIGAANREQAGIIKERISHLLHFNPWLSEYVEMNRMEVRSTKKSGSGRPMARVDIMSADVAGSHGGTPDLLIINELSHVVRWEFVENLMDNAAGFAQGMVIIATNAGFTQTPAHKWKLNATQSEEWATHIWSKPAPWHRKEDVADAAKRNAPSRFQRLWWGRWISGSGDALSDELINSVFTLKGPTFVREPGWDYIAGLDIGIRRDHSALVVLGVNYLEYKIKVCWWKAWIPPERGQDIDLIDVRDTIYSMWKVFGFLLAFDPHQAELMVQELRRDGVECKSVHFSSRAKTDIMANTLIQALRSGTLACYNDPEDRLKKDFGKLTLKESAYGYKLEAASDAEGHADVGFALILALPEAVARLPAHRIYPDDPVGFEGKEPEDLTKKDLDDMPQEFQDLFVEDFEDLD